jgi:GNAT superfamily N-acetyltransferase
VSQGYVKIEGDLWRDVLGKGRRKSRDEANFTFGWLQAPMERWPKDIGKIRRMAFPSSFGDSFPALIRYRGWMVTASVGDQVVGFALCDFVEGENIILLEEVAVLPDFQCRGIGTSLVHQCALHAQELGFTSIWSSPLVGEGEDRRASWMERIGLPSTIGFGNLISEVIERSVIQLPNPGEGLPPQ